MEWDVFISHAGEDKATVALPLSKLLEQAGLRVWLDANELTLGDSLSRKIDEGLACSTYGIVILSQNFFRKNWPMHELAGLVARQLNGRKVILPVWHEIDHADILQYSPPLADAFAVSTALGLERVTEEINRAVREPAPPPVPGPLPVAPKRKGRSRWIAGITLFTILVVSFGLWFYSKRLRDEEYQRRRQSENQGRNSMNGYLVVSCNTCLRPRAWAFHLPPTREGGPRKPEDIESMRNQMPSWPMQEFLYPEDKPPVGSCVNVPERVCQASYTWKPSHELQKTRGHVPVLQLDLKLRIGGYETLITNQGDTLAQGIHVDVAAWQPGSPGIGVLKSYSVRDLSSWADFTIIRVFGDLQ